MRYQSDIRLSEPVFVDSAGVSGIQVADAFAYCTFINKSNPPAFQNYWNIVRSKLRKNSSGDVMGYGYKEYPC